MLRTRAQLRGAVHMPNSRLYAIDARRDGNAAPPPAGMRPPVFCRLL